MVVKVDRCGDVCLFVKEGGTVLDLFATRIERKCCHAIISHMIHLFHLRYLIYRN